MVIHTYNVYFLSTYIIYIDMYIFNTHICIKYIHYKNIYVHTHKYLYNVYTHAFIMYSMHTCIYIT